MGALKGAYTLFSNLLRGAAPQARFARTSLIDTATDPRTYQGLAQSASDTLGRALPPQFRGAGFQNVPTRALGALDDAAAAPFAGQARQQVLDKASKEFRRQAGSGTTRVPVIPTGGQPLRVSPGGRYTTLPDAAPLNNAQKLGIVSGATGLTTGGAVLATNGNQSIEQRLNNIGPAIDEYIGGLNFPGQRALEQYGRDQEKRGFGSLLDFTGGLLGPFAAGLVPNSEAKATERVKAKDPLALREQYGGSGDMDADDAATYNAGTGEYTFNSDVVPPAPQLPAPPVPQTPASSLQDLPPSPEQVQVMDPFAYNLSVYGQGRQAAQSQDAQAKVRDLGLAIHKAKYPQLYQESYNPLMAATFPERYAKTPQDFVVEGGIQAPRSMITKDDEQAIIDANGGEIFTSLDQPTSVVQELLRQAAAKKKGG